VSYVAAAEFDKVTGMNLYLVELNVEGLLAHGVSGAEIYAADLDEAFEVSRSLYGDTVDSVVVADGID
jgi:hypothetical protein